MWIQAYGGQYVNVSQLIRMDVDEPISGAWRVVGWTYPTGTASGINLVYGLATEAEAQAALLRILAGQCP